MVRKGEPVVNTLMNAIQVRDAAEALITKCDEYRITWSEVKALRVALATLRANTVPVRILAMEGGDD